MVGAGLADIDEECQVSDRRSRSEASMAKTKPTRDT
jgi:hypothetical protein